MPNSNLNPTNNNGLGTAHGVSGHTLQQDAAQTTSLASLDPFISSRFEP